MRGQPHDGTVKKSQRRGFIHSTHRWSLRRQRRRYVERHAFGFELLEERRVLSTIFLEESDVGVGSSAVENIEPNVAAEISRSDFGDAPDGVLGFSSPKFLAIGSPFFVLNPQVTTDGVGNWVAVWESFDSLGGTIGEDRDILFSRSSDAGQTWTDPAALNSYATIDDESFNLDFVPQVTTDGLGNWIAVWESTFNLGDAIGTDTDILFARSTDAGETWTDAAPLHANADSDVAPDYAPQVTTDGLGNWVAVWETNGDILVSRSTNAGNTWDSPSRLTTDVDLAFDVSPQVTTDGKGNWVAVWVTFGEETLGEDEDILVSRSTNAGQTWTTPIALNSNALSDFGADRAPQVTTDGEGNWVAAWFSTESLGGTIGEDWDILVSRSTNLGNTWTAPEPLNSNAASDSPFPIGSDDVSPQVTTDGLGHWVAVWEKGAGSTAEPFMALSTDAGETWTQESVLGDADAGRAPQLTTDGRGNWVAILFDSAISVATSEEAPRYPTLMVNNGARHVAASGLLLGKVVDEETDGQPNESATGDDINGFPNDEDGVAFDTPIFVGENSASLTVNVSGTNAKLDGWIDFDGDGSWLGAGEQIFDGFDVIVGSNDLTFAVPADAHGGQTYARFRVSSRGGLLPTGMASDGEVEDYAIEIVDTAWISGQKFNDLNDNDARDAGEAGLNGWAIQLLDEGGALVAETTTMSMDLDGSGDIDPRTEQGLYRFENVAPMPLQPDEIDIIQLPDTMHEYTNGGNTPEHGHDGDANTAHSRSAGNSVGSSIISEHFFPSPVEIDRIYWKARAAGHAIGKFDRGCQLGLNLEYKSTTVTDWTHVPDSTEVSISELCSPGPRIIDVDETIDAMSLHDITAVRVRTESIGWTTDSTADAGSTSFIFEIQALVDSQPTPDYRVREIQQSAWEQTFPASGDYFLTITEPGRIDDIDFGNHQIAQPSVRFTTTGQTGVENVGTMTLMAELSAISGEDVTVPFSVSGSASEGADYTITGSPVVIPAGSIATNVSITVNDDAVDEPDETVIVTMEAPTNATRGSTVVYTATIQDNDEAGLGVSSLASMVTVPGTTTTSSVQVTSSGTGKLDGWIDFDGDGDWDDDGEQILANVDVESGPNLLAFSVPGDAIAGDAAARFSWRSDTGSLVVEDYTFTILDGAVSPDVEVQAVIDTVMIAFDSGHIVVRSRQVDLFNAPLDNAGSLSVAGPPNGLMRVTIDATLELPEGGLVVEGGSDQSTLAVSGDGVLDLTNPLVSITRFGRLDLSASTLNTITIDAAVVASMSPETKTLTVVAAEGDRLVVSDAEDWRMSSPVMHDGQFHLVANHATSGGTESIQADLPHAWQNFIRFGDVNNDGSVTAADALRIINELAWRIHSDPDTNALHDPLTVEQWPGIYFDQNGDGRATALDALRVINELARLVSPFADEGESISSGLFSAKLAESRDHPQPTDAAVFSTRELLNDETITERLAFEQNVTLTKGDQPKGQTRLRALDDLLADASFISLLMDDFGNH